MIAIHCAAEAMFTGTTRSISEIMSVRAQINPSSKPRKTARVQSRTPSFERTVETCVLTVASALPSGSEISRLLNPAAMRRSTSFSLDVSASGSSDTSKDG